MQTSIKNFATTVKDALASRTPQDERRCRSCPGLVLPWIDSETINLFLHHRLLRCGSCGAVMAYHYTKRGNRLYRYYVCTTVQKQGRDACLTPSLPAQEIEDFVVEQIRRIARDPDLAKRVFAEAVKQQQATKPQLEAEAKRLQRERQQKADRSDGWWQQSRP